MASECLIVTTSQISDFRREILYNFSPTMFTQFYNQAKTDPTTIPMINPTTSPMIESMNTVH